MCTVSYVPLEKGYVLTSNRDENPTRQTKLPNKISLKNGTTIYSPIDVLKGGSWIAMDKAGRTACLLNGGFVKHEPKPSYRKSRGKFVLDAFEASNFTDYALSVFLDDIEPLTLVLIEPNNIQLLVWDGIRKHISQLPSNAPHLWSSSTLYSANEHAKKKAYFLEEISGNENNIKLILRIHGKDQATPFTLRHPRLRTVSITQVIYNDEQSRLNYILKDSANETSDSLSLVCN